MKKQGEEVIKRCESESQVNAGSDRPAATDARLIRYFGTVGDRQKRYILFPVLL